ncbi:MAG: substrate-binding periplasmic protein [Gammaproteobacteria bacterium]
MSKVLSLARRRWPGLIMVVALAGLIAGCGMPRDPEGALGRIEDGILRVGISENRPWTRIDDGRVSGVEVRLLRELARQLNARIVWAQGSEAELLEALRMFQLDVVIAGLTYDSPWATEIGASQPYYTSRLTIGVPATRRLSADFADTLDGRRIGVQLGRASGGYVEELGAIPEPVRDLAAYRGPVAAYAWELERWGYKDTGLVLYEAEHIVAAPPGENAWLVRLERFLLSARDRVHRWLTGPT